MAVIVTIANQKGGSGKSTITALVANALSQDHKQKVLVVDTDLQASLAHMRSAITASKGGNAELFAGELFSYELIQKPLNQLMEFCTSVYNTYDLILVDMPGILYTPEGSSKDIVSFLYICDVVLIPVRAGLFDIDSSVSFLKKLKEMQDFKAKKGLTMIVLSFINYFQKNLENNELGGVLKANGFDLMKNH